MHLRGNDNARIDVVVTGARDCLKVSRRSRPHGKDGVLGAANGVRFDHGRSRRRVHVPNAVRRAAICQARGVGYAARYIYGQRIVESSRVHRRRESVFRVRERVAVYSNSAGNGIVRRHSVDGAHGYAEHQRVGIGSGMCGVKYEHGKRAHVHELRNSKRHLELCG